MLSAGVAFRQQLRPISTDFDGLLCRFGDLGMAPWNIRKGVAQRIMALGRTGLHPHTAAGWMQKGRSGCAAAWNVDADACEREPLVLVVPV
jgi:hypothetical protein